MTIVLSRICGCLCLGIWIYLVYFRGGFWRLRERLSARTGLSGGTVTAIIPARDESGFIGRAVRSLRAQEFAGTLRIVVADDESSDNTADEAATAGADAVIRVASRPPQWKGKLWALDCGIRAATERPNYFLLTDADIEYVAPVILNSLLDKAQGGFDLVSVMVRLRRESIAEKLLIPAFVFFFFMLYPPAWVESGSGGAAAAGGCMLIRREMLEKIGGMGSIRAELIDDCALARRVQAAGGRVWLGVSEAEIRSIRGYGGAREIRDMIARSAFAQLRHSAILLLGTIAGMLLTYVMPVLLLLSRDWPSRAAGATAWLAAAWTFGKSVRFYRAPSWTALLLPAIACFYLLATVQSAVDYWRGAGGKWKGRVQDMRHR